jgi:hypothetical protein
VELVRPGLIVPQWHQSHIYAVSSLPRNCTLESFLPVP